MVVLGCRIKSQHYYDKWVCITSKQHSQDTKPSQFPCWYQLNLKLVFNIYGTKAGQISLTRIILNSFGIFWLFVAFKHKKIKKNPHLIKTNQPNSFRTQCFLCNKGKRKWKICLKNNIKSSSLRNLFLKVYFTMSYNLIFIRFIKFGGYCQKHPQTSRVFLLLVLLFTF